MSDELSAMNLIAWSWRLELAARNGSRSERMLFGQTSVGATRVTFEIGLDGRLPRAWKRMKTAEYSQAVPQASRTGRQLATRSA